MTDFVEGRLRAALEQRDPGPAPGIAPGARAGGALWRERGAGGARQGHRLGDCGGRAGRGRRPGRCRGRDVDPP